MTIHHLFFLIFPLTTLTMDLRKTRNKLPVHFRVDHKKETDIVLIKRLIHINFDMNLLDGGKCKGVARLPNIAADKSRLMMLGFMEKLVCQQYRVKLRGMNLQ